MPAGTSGFHGLLPINCQADPADSAPMIGLRRPYIGIEDGGGDSVAWTPPAMARSCGAAAGRRDAAAGGATA